MDGCAYITSFRVDLDNLCVWRTDEGESAVRVKLTPKGFDVLRYLMEHSDRLVTHEELLQAVWRKVHVQPEVVKSHILAIRSALGEKADGRHYIKTLRGRGYQFAGSVDCMAAPGISRNVPREANLFVGREKPLGDLLRAFRRTTAGEQQSVFIRGELGIGKTTLVHEFLNQLPDRTAVLLAEGNSIEGFAGTEPYYPLFGALDTLCKGPAGAIVRHLLLAVAPAWAVQMPAQIPVEQRAAILPQLLEGARGRMVREAIHLFEAIAAQHPLILVLEDLHWADYATIDFLSAVCRRRSNAKLMLIATYRPDDFRSARHPLKQIATDLAVRQQCTEIELGPLSPPAISQVLQGGPEGEPASAILVQYAQKRSGGNPLFLQIALDHLSERGAMIRTGNGWRIIAPIDDLKLETPTTLKRLIESRLVAMSAEQQRVLQLGSVAGVRFESASVSRAAGMSRHVLEAILEKLNFVHADDVQTLPDSDLVQTYAFNHEIYRQVIYERIPRALRSRLHCAIGDALESLYPPEQRDDLAIHLAHHFAAAGDWLRAIEYVRSALKAPTRRFAHRDTLAVLDRALELASQLPSGSRISAEIEFLERRAVIQSAAHDPDTSITYARIIALATSNGNTETRIRAMLGLSYALSWHKVGESLKILDDVLLLCEKLNNETNKDFIRITAYVRRIWSAGWNREDARQCEAALVRLRAQADPRTVARAQLTFGMICMVSSRYGEANDLVRKSYRLLSENATGMAEPDLARLAWMHHVGMPWSMFSMGKFGAALDAFDASMAKFESNGEMSVVRSLAIYRSILMFHAFDFEEVLRTCRPEIENFSDNLGSDISESAKILPLEYRIALISSGLAEVGLGNHAQGLQYMLMAERQMNQAPAHLDWYWRLAMMWGQVCAYIALADSISARQYAEKFLALAVRTDDFAWQVLAYDVQARTALMRGARTEAAEHVRRALIVSDDACVPLAQWRVHATAADVYDAIGDCKTAERHMAAALDITRQIASSMPQGHRNRLIFESRCAVFSLHAHRYARISRKEMN